VDGISLSAHSMIICSKIISSSPLVLQPPGNCYVLLLFTILLSLDGRNRRDNLLGMRD
jgi:hypothetical protein